MPSPAAALPTLLGALSWPEWRHHPWRHATALLAVALGVALAFSVHVINASALAEFAGAVRAANGEPDLRLEATAREGFDDGLFDRVLLDPQVAAASPILEFDTQARAAGGERRASVHVLGIDALRVSAVAPALLPRPDEGAGRSALIDPGLAYANAAAMERLGLTPGGELDLLSTRGWQRLRLAGRVAVGGAPLVVVDVSAAQARFGFEGRLTRIDLRLATGVSRADALAALTAQALPAGVRVAGAEDADERISALSRAYRVNLTVLALVALFVGAFLVYSVLALSVAQRTPQFALLGVLGLDAPRRRTLVLVESACLGAIGSALGLAGGTALAWAALQALGGDLGGGYFPGVSPTLQVGPLAALAYFAAGVAAATAGAWWPARAAEAVVPAQALKGMGQWQARAARWRPGLALLAAGVLLALLPPWRGLPLAAYLSVAALLAGGVALVPWVVQAMLSRLHPQRHALALLAVRRAHFARATASAAVAGVVASLALSVALTVMVTSFRDAVSQWLDVVLPADLYLRSAPSASASDQAALPAGFVDAASRIPGVLRVQAARTRPLQLHPQRPPVALIARPLEPDPAAALALLEAPRPARPGELAVYVSEPLASIYGVAAGDLLSLPLGGALDAPVQARVRGVWRDYARQFGALAIDADDYRRLTGDLRQNDLALWLAPGTAPADVTQRLRALAGDAVPLESAATGELRAISLAIFDRSFAVTSYLQVVAIAVGLVGIAASLSAQVLARRKEFGLLAHLGLTRAQVLALVAGESAAWLAAGALMGLALGLAVAVVLVKVVNPQSFHWTMPILLPWARLAALMLAVLLAGVATALLAGRRAAGRDMVLAVKEDW